jgi:hypothetical protein
MGELVIDQPGIYDIPEDLYHRDPVPGGSLSASNAKKLLADGGPAKYRYFLDNPEEPRDEFDFGTAAHTLTLGTGAPLIEVKADNWRTDKAKDAAKEARDAGAVPLLTKDIKVVYAMADALGAHPTAAALLNPERGRPEMSAFWLDEQWKIWRRCRYDFMPHHDPRRTAVIADYKTCARADPRSFAKAVADFGYYLSAAWYCDGWRAIYGTDPGFAFIAQEKTPPYLVATYQLDGEALAIGRHDGERAMEIWRDCREAEAEGRAYAWPGYSHEIETIALPRWSRAREDFYA